MFILDLAAATLSYVMPLYADAVAAALYELAEVGIDERAAAAISLIRLGLTLTLLEADCCTNGGTAAAAT